MHRKKPSENSFEASSSLTVVEYRRGDEDKHSFFVQRSSIPDDTMSSYLQQGAGVLLGMGRRKRYFLRLQ